MLEPWTLPIGILSVLAILLLVPLFELAGTSLRSATFWCPFSKRKVTASFAEKGALGIGTRIDVCSCTAFEDPDVVTCRKGCLGLPESALQEAHVA